VEERMKKAILAGISKRTLKKKRKMLIKLIKTKFGISQEEIQKIEAYADRQRLEAAIESVIFSKKKEFVLQELED
jgi:hypothetical protein